MTVFLFLNGGFLRSSSASSLAEKTETALAWHSSTLNILVGYKLTVGEEIRFAGGITSNKSVKALSVTLVGFLGRAAFREIFAPFVVVVHCSFLTASAINS